MSPDISFERLAYQKESLVGVAELEKSAADASALLKSMANESRLLILCHLTEGEKSVGELQELVGLGQSALSQHLAILRRDRLVKTRRSAQSIFYSLASDAAQAIMGTLYELFCHRTEHRKPRRKKTQTRIRAA